MVMEFVAAAEGAVPTSETRGGVVGFGLEFLDSHIKFINKTLKKLKKRRNCFKINIKSLPN